MRRPKAGIRGSALLAAVAAVFCACTAAAPPPEQARAIRIATPGGMASLLAELSAAYQLAHPEVRVELQPGNSGSALESLRAGSADVAAVSWQLVEEQESALRAHPIARDALAVVVHPDNPVSDMGLAQLRNLYRGETLDWSQLGASQRPTTVISREDGSGDRAAFEAIVMQGDRVTLNALVMPSAEAVIGYVSGHPGAVGYVPAGFVTARVRALPIESVLPSADSVREGSYPLSRQLYLCVRAPVEATTQEFVDFVLSPVGRTIVNRHHVALR